MKAAQKAEDPADLKLLMCIFFGFNRITSVMFSTEYESRTEKPGAAAFKSSIPGQYYLLLHS